MEQSKYQLAWVFGYLESGVDKLVGGVVHPLLKVGRQKSGTESPLRKKLLEDVPNEGRSN